MLLFFCFPHHIAVIFERVLSREQNVPLLRLMALAKCVQRLSEAKGALCKARWNLLCRQQLHVVFFIRV